MEINGFIVDVDIDNEQGFENIKKYIPADLDIPKSKTPKGGQHWYFAYDAIEINKEVKESGKNRN